MDDVLFGQCDAVFIDLTQLLAVLTLPRTDLTQAIALLTRSQAHLTQLLPVLHLPNHGYATPFSRSQAGLAAITDVSAAGNRIPASRTQHSRRAGLN
jgi:hypothetical protein